MFGNGSTFEPLEVQAWLGKPSWLWFAPVPFLLQPACRPSEAATFDVDFRLPDARPAGAQKATCTVHSVHSVFASQLGASFGCLARTLSCLLSLRCDKDDAEAELEPQPEPGLFCRP